MEAELCGFSGRQLWLLIQSHLWIVQVRVVTAVNFFRDVTLVNHQVKGVSCYGRTWYKHAFFDHSQSQEQIYCEKRSNQRVSGD